MEKYPLGRCSHRGEEENSSKQAEEFYKDTRHLGLRAWFFL